MHIFTNLSIYQYIYTYLCRERGRESSIMSTLFLVGNGAFLALLEIRGFLVGFRILPGEGIIFDPQVSHAPLMMARRCHFRLGCAIFAKIIGKFRLRVGIFWGCFFGKKWMCVCGNLGPLLCMMGTTKMCFFFWISDHFWVDPVELWSVDVLCKASSPLLLGELVPSIIWFTHYCKWSYIRYFYEKTWFVRAFWKILEKPIMGDLSWQI